MTEPVWKSRPGEMYAAKLETKKLNDFIYMSEGFSNTFMITTSEGRIIINTGMGHEAPIHKMNFDAICDDPTRYIILTQGHVDHVGGVDVFLEEGTEVIAQAGNAEHQAYDNRLAQFRGSRSGFAFIDRIMKAVEYVTEVAGGPAPQSIPEPTITFEDTMDLELGGLKMQLIGIAGGETNDSLVVWLPEHKIAFVGNLFSCLFGHFPNLVTIRGDRYRDALTVADAVKQVMDLDPELLIVGHHDPIEGKALIREELERLHGAIMYVHNATVQGMNDGKDVHTLMQEIKLPPELEVGEGYGKVSWSVRAIWENYAGWFHHESTTELYSIPQKAIHPDLIELAGGPQAIVDRARQKLDAGNAVEALHLTDIVLSQDNAPVSAIEVALDAHKALLPESVNFWLTNWLENQIKLLQARKDG